MDPDFRRFQGKRSGLLALSPAPVLIAIALLAPWIAAPSLHAASLPPGITSADVELAKRTIFSPESGATLRPDKAALLDTNHDGILALEDLNGLPGSHSRWKTLFVAPQPPVDARNDAPLGACRNPFILTESSVTSAGGFYDQLRRITFASAGGPGCNAEIVFLPGTYSRIQLILRNADEPVAGKPAIKAVIDRLHPVRLFLRSLHPLSDDPNQQAFFFGGSQGKDQAGILKYGPAIRSKADTQDGGDPHFLQIQGDIKTAPKLKISGIMVSGLRVACYRSGIDLQYARNIVLKNNRLEMLGSARTPQEAAAIPASKPSAVTPVMYGTYAIGMARMCEHILVKNNRITDAWSRYNAPAPASHGDTGLMHAFYIINTGDAVYLDNRVEDCSGPAFKVVDLPDFNADGTVKPGPAFGRQVLINNSFLQTTGSLGGLYPVDADVMAMIHDNSAQIRPLPARHIYTQPSPPAANLIFLGNTWETRIPMDFLRRESVTTSRDGVSGIPARFPNWFFEGNSWLGFPNGPRIMERRRGMDPISFKRDITDEVTTSPAETVRLAPFAQPYAFDKCLARLRQLAPDDPGLLEIVGKREIPGVSTDN
jgi:hypothetical protein